MQPLGKLVVLGVGLIGGSFALALKRAGCVRSVIGVGRSQSNLDAAHRLSIADRVLTLDQRWTDELRDADLVLLATPVGQMPALLAAMAPHIGATTLITDVGSTKQDVVAAARGCLGAALPRFVPAHPVAGVERAGAAAAFDTLFRDRNVVLTPVAETASAATESISACWAACGGVVRIMEPERHDAIMAAVSHLPHVLAFALVAELAQRSNADDYFGLAGSGFRDFSRLASSETEMWRDICLANHVALRRELSTYRAQLDRLDALIDAGDGAALAAVFSRARDARTAWLASNGLDTGED